MSAISKSEIIALFLEQFERELATLVNSAKEAHAAATHEEVIQEDKHDTRAIEASYLAAGQAHRANELEKVILEFRGLMENLPPPSKVIRAGSVVQLSTAGKNFYSFIAVHGGGTQIKVPNSESLITVTTLSSPLGEALFEMKAGDEVEIETKNGTREYQILSAE